MLKQAVLCTVLVEVSSFTAGAQSPAMRPIQLKRESSTTRTS